MNRASTMSEQSDPIRRLQAASRRGSTPALLLKRLIDLGVALPLGLALAPLGLLVALAIRIDSSGPILFRQRRRGLRFQPFTMLKFRSLEHGAGDPHDRYEMCESDSRITRVGAWIRRTSLDELPQLLNVIGGSMSLVGPRPLVEWESRECLVRHEKRFLVKPGITGLSQVMVRNAVELDARSDWDVEYVRRWSIPLDLGILLKTPLSIFRSGTIYPTPPQGANDGE
jgi:lipopolysaccharide/colanic/teichoic acid biosynthesis glycosyltransferase